MQVKTEIKQKTMDDMLNRLRKLGTKKALRAPAAAVRAGSSVIIKATRPSVPVDTGTLRKAIGQKVKSKRVYATSVFGVRNRKVTTKSGKIKNAVRYAHLVEFGKRGEPANPFLRPSFDSSAASARRAVIRKMIDIFRTEANKVRKIA